MAQEGLIYFSLTHSLNANKKSSHTLFYSSTHEMSTEFILNIGDLHCKQKTHTNHLLSFHCLESVLVYMDLYGLTPAHHSNLIFQHL